MPALKIYRSSAGSGKTYVLVSSYIKIVLEDPKAFAKIAAATFTNKVAQEMKQRILNCLISLAQGNVQALAQEIMKEKLWTIDQLKTKATSAFLEIVKDYDMFAVFTIDGFFQKIIRTFVCELDLYADFKLELNNNSVVHVIVDSLISSINSNEQLKDWILQLVEERISAGKNWDLRYELTPFANEIFKESLQIKNNQNSTDAFKLLQSFKKCINEFENTIHKLASKALEIINENGLTIEDFAYGINGVIGYLYKTANKISFEPTKRVLHAALSIDAWYTKSSAKKNEIRDIASKHLQPILLQVIEFYQNHKVEYNTALVSKKVIYLVGIASEIKKVLENYKKEHNTIFVSDVPLLLKVIIKDGCIAPLYEANSMPYNHFFIDEFQDGSLLQWEIFKFLIRYNLANSYSSLVVGDAKQSIYRWRNSDWRLLLNQIELDIQPTKSIVLNINWRSKKNIVKFNNTFFPLAASTITEYLSDTINEIDEYTLKNIVNDEVKQILFDEVKQIGNIYESSIQQLPQNHSHKNKGYVRIAFLDEESDDNADKNIEFNSAQSHFIDLIESLQSEGVLLRDIAILVRNHKDERNVFKALSDRKNSQKNNSYRYDAISLVSIRLGQNSFVNIIINAIKYLINENDHIAKCTLHYLYKNHIEKIDKEDANDMFHSLKMDVFMQNKRLLQQLPLLAFVETIIYQLQLYTQESAPYIMAFKDSLLKAIEITPMDFNDFVNWWEKTGNMEFVPIPETQDAVRIMTIHQSKGLQFKVVIIPFCDWNFDHSVTHSPTLWCDYKRDGHITQIPMKYSSKLKDTLYTQNYYKEQIESYLDNLNLLYVAFTRSEDRMYVFTTLPKKDDTIKTVAHLLYKIIEQIINKEKHAEFNWDSNILKLGEPEAIQSTKESLNMIDLTISYDHDKFKINSKRNQISDFISVLFKKTVDTPRIDFGVLVHYILAQIRKESDVARVLEYTSRLDIDKAILDKALLQVQDIMQSEYSKEWFSEKWESKSEHSILLSSGKIVRPDKVLIGNDKTIIVDFKTGKEKNQDAIQIKEYVTALQELGHNNVFAYLFYTNTMCVKEFSATHHSNKL